MVYTTIWETMNMMKMNNGELIQASFSFPTRPCLFVPVHCPPSPTCTTRGPKITTKVVKIGQLLSTPFYNFRVIDRYRDMYYNLLKNRHKCKLFNLGDSVKIKYK